MAHKVVAPFLLLLAAAAVVSSLPAAAAAKAVSPVLTPGPAAPPANITKILSRYPEFTLFSGLLAETGLARAISARPLVTVLALNNTAVTGAVRRLPRPLLADLLSLHVVLDYLDQERIDALRRGRTGNGSIVATMLKGTGARFLRVAGGEDGRVTFSYAGPGGGGKRNATLVRVVTKQAYRVLVLQVSGLVLPAAVPAISAAPIDITMILNRYPEFVALNSLLTQTGVARSINALPVVTVLAVNNTALSRDLQGMPRLPRQLVAEHLALQAVVDFLDPEKLDALRRGKTGNGSMVTTLLQGTGNARGRGALQVSGGEDGSITFTSTAPGSGGPLNATLVRVVTMQANTVVVLEVSGLILPAVVPSINAAPFDITNILSGYPEFSVFNSLLNQTGLARSINARKVVTVLAVNNTALSHDLSSLPRQPMEKVAELLALHAALDFLDAQKLDALRRGKKGNGSIVTTLLQGPGNTRGRGSGFIRVSGCDDGQHIMFSSAAAGTDRSRNATLVRVVTAQANTVLVLEVSGLVVPPGIAKPQQPARHMSLPPSPAPTPQYPPASGPGLLSPSPMLPVPTPPNLTDTPSPAAGNGIIPIPSVHGGVAAKVPSASSAGHRAASWPGVAGVAPKIMACLIMLVSLQ